MNVLFNALQAGNRSGTGRYAAELARRLPSLGDVSVLWPEGLAVSEEIHAARVIHAAASPAWKRLKADQFDIARFARECDADLLHYPANIGRLVGGLRTILTVHDLSFFRNSGWFRPGRAMYYRWGAARSVRLASRVVADSTATADDLIQFLGVGPKLIDMVPLGIGAAFCPQDAPAIQAVREAFNLPERYFLYAGTIEPRKNVAQIVRAWERIADGSDAPLVIAGRDGWKTSDVYDAIRQSNHQSRIHRTGFVDDEQLPALLSGALAFVWPSLCEGFGLPPLEAMACGAPVITSNLSSLPEIVGDAALTLDPTDITALADAMLRVAKDDALRRDLRQAGLDRARQFTWNRTAQMTLESYRAALPPL